MDGMGTVSTSSPTVPFGTSSPSPFGPLASLPAPAGPQDATADPRHRTDSSPGHTGTVGTPAMNALHTSVPPEIDHRGTPGSRCACQRWMSGDSGDPVLPIARSRASVRATR